jgi:pyrroline-5-carboxylate reductase
MAAIIRVGFLGAGKMASALASGLVRAGIAPAEAILASDVSAPARTAFTQATGAKTTGFNPDVAKFAPVLILAVKPDQIEDLLAELAPDLSEQHLIISIAAGVTLARLEAAVQPGVRVVRVMPNTPALVGASASAFALGRGACAEDAQLVSMLFSAVGLALQVKESLLDAVTGLSGSGPAYVYTIIEALSDGGVAAGLPRDVATRLAAQTVLGGAKMVLDTGLHTGTLKDMVTSPGGTTIEGIHELERGGVRAALMNAVRAAADKSKKLGQG